MTLLIEIFKISMKTPQSRRGCAAKMAKLFRGFFIDYFVGNKAKGRISRRVFQENKLQPNFPENEHFLPPDMHTYVHCP